MVLLTWIVAIVAVAAVIVYLWAWRQAPEKNPPGQSVPLEPSVTFGTPFLEPTVTLGAAPPPPVEEQTAPEAVVSEVAGPEENIPGADPKVPATESPAPAPAEEEPEPDPPEPEDLPRT